MYTVATAYANMQNTLLIVKTGSFSCPVWLFRINYNGLVGHGSKLKNPNVSSITTADILGDDAATVEALLIVHSPLNATI